MKAEQLTRMPVAQAIQQMKDESTPRYRWEMDDSKRCLVKADETVLDDWGDHCTGYRCLLTAGHTGEHQISDGANGYEYFDDSQALKEKQIETEKTVEHEKDIIPEPITHNNSPDGWFTSLIKAARKLL